MDELINAFKAQMYDKARSPFLSAFAFSWASWNLKTIIVIFSSGEIGIKLKLINQLYPNVVFYGAQWVLYPMVSAAIFIGVYPVIARFAFSYWNNQNNIIKQIQVTQDDKVPPSAEEGRRLRKLISDVSIEKQKVIDDLVEKNSELMQKDDTVNNLIAQLESEKRDLSKGVESKDLIISDLTKLNEELQEKISVLSQDKIEWVTRSHNQADKDRQQTDYIESLNVSIESLNENEKKDANKLLESLYRFQKKYDINAEQLELLIFLLVSKGRQSPQNVQRSLKLEEIKSEAIIGTLQKRKLIENDVFGEKVELTSQFRNDIYELGILSVPNYMALLSKIFF